MEIKKYIPTRNQILCILLILAVCINTYYHTQSPAYLYYTTKFRDFRSEFDSFKGQLRDEFIPAILLIATNNHVVVASDLSASAVSNSKSDNSLGILNASYFVCDHKPYFRFNDIDFTVGDDFYGYPVVGISPTIVTTSQGIFYLKTSPYHKKEGDKNDCGPIL